MTARRANRRWLDGDCPADVLAIFRDDSTMDRWTILYVPLPGQTWIDYLGASDHPSSPQGVGIHGELSTWDAAAYRYRETGRKHSARWTELPADVQAAVRDDCRGLAAVRAAHRPARTH